MINFEFLCELAEEMEASSALVELQCNRLKREQKESMGSISSESMESISSCNDVLVKLKAQKLLAINRQKLLTILNFNICIQEMKFIFESRSIPRSSSLAIMSKYRKKVDALQQTSPESRDQIIRPTSLSPLSTLAAFEALPKISLKKSLYFNDKVARKTVIPFPKKCKQQPQHQLFINHPGSKSRPVSVRFCR